MVSTQTSSASPPLAHNDDRLLNKEARSTEPSQIVEAKLTTISPSNKNGDPLATKITAHVSTGTAYSSPVTTQTVEKEQSNSASSAKPAVTTAPIFSQAQPNISVPSSPHAEELMSENQDMNDSLNSAQRKLLEILGEGMHIIKHGRQSAPKQRLLRCNRQATELFIQADDHRKTLKLSEVQSIRLGTEVDPFLHHKL
jgi:hypothetical protein